MPRIMGEFSAHLVAVLFVLSCAIQVRSSIWDHRYNINDSVPFYVNKVGSFYTNPSETYAYYDLPFCSPDHAVEKKWSLGDMLNGDRFVSAPYKLEFRVDKYFEVACTKKLTKEEIEKFQFAIAKSYELKMYYDDLPITAIIGRVDYYNTIPGDLKKMGRLEIYLGHSQFRSFYGRVDYNAKREDYKYQMFTHIDFQISYNNDRVTYIVPIVGTFAYNTPVELTEDKGVEVEFSYSARWFQWNDSFEERMHEYSSDKGRDWSSMMGSSSFILVLLGCLVMFYVWVHEENLNKEIVEKKEETGVENIHGDVLCYPKHKSLFAAAIGCGTQLIVLVFFTLVLGIFRVLHPYKGGALRSGLVVTYAITSSVAGYVSASLYSQLQGTNRVQNILLTGSLFNVPLSVAFSVINSVAVTYGVTSALSIGTILVLLCIWLFGALPLLLLGGIIVKKKGCESSVACSNTICLSEYSQLSWYKGVVIQMGLAGMVSFGVMNTEFFFLLGSIWFQNKYLGVYIYTTYPVLLIVATVTVIVIGSVTVALSYSQLSTEKYEWRWRSFLIGGSTGFYVFGYCLYFYHWYTDMSGVLQTLFFVGYMACVSYGLFLMFGTVGFFASLLFVRCVRGSTKCE